MSFSTESIQKFIEANPIPAALTAGALVVGTAFVCCWRGRKVNNGMQMPDATVVAAAKAALKPASAPASTSAPAATDDKKNAPAALPIAFILNIESEYTEVGFPNQKAVTDFLKTDLKQFAETQVVHLTFITDESLPSKEQKQSLLAVFPKLAEIVLALPYAAQKEWSWNIPASVKQKRNVADKV